MQYLHLFVHSDRGHGRADRRNPVRSGAAADPADGRAGEFARLAVQYLQVYALCSPGTTMLFAVDNYLRICGYIRGSMWMNVLMSVLSCLLEVLFLGVFGWGIWAAALATCTSMFVCVLLSLIPFLRKRAVLRFCKPRFHARLVRQIVACGSPNFLNNIAAGSRPS